MSSDRFVWEGRPAAPEKLRFYRGWFTWLGRAFIAMGLGTGLIVWANRAEIEGTGTTILAAVFVLFPIALGLVFTQAFPRMARHARKGTTYGVTATTAVIETPGGTERHTIAKDSPIVPKRRGDRSSVTFTHARTRTSMRGTSEGTLAQTQVHSAARGFANLTEDQLDGAVAALEAAKSRAK